MGLAAFNQRRRLAAKRQQSGQKTKQYVGPTSQNSKSEIIDWLDSHELGFDESDTKANLVKIAKESEAAWQ